VTLSLRSSLFTRHGFRHGFSLRSGGVSEAPFATLNLARGVGDDPEHVSENRARLGRDIGYDPLQLYEVSQVHGAHVESVHFSGPAASFRERAADALYCREIGTAIGVRVADCAAILLAHPQSGAVAAVHAGWRGVVRGVLEATLAALCSDGSARPEQLIAAVFPHIGVGAFEVGPDVAEQIAASAPDDPNVVVRTGERPHADLGRAIQAQLRRAGLLRAHVERVAGCTFSEPERFFSYRRDGAASGRHLAVIVAGC
jgi:YfiH family protein